MALSIISGFQNDQKMSYQSTLKLIPKRDKIGKRGPVVLVGLIISWGFVVRFPLPKTIKIQSSHINPPIQIGMLVIRTTTDKRLHFAIFTLTLGFSNPWRKFSSYSPIPCPFLSTHDQPLVTHKFGYFKPIIIIENPLNY